MTLRGLTTNLQELPVAVRVALTALLVVAAAGLTLLLQPWLGMTRMALFFAAVLGATLIGGFAQGALATVLSVIAAQLTIITPGEATVTLPLTLQLLVWWVIGLVAALVIDRMQRARREAEERRADVERLAERLEEQASELELQVTESEAMANELEELNQQLAEQTDAAQRAATRAERLQRFTAYLHERVGAAGIARHIVEEGRRAVEADAAAVVVVREDGAFEVVAAQGYPDEVLGADHPLYRGRTPLYDAIRTRQPVWIEDEARLREEYPGLAGHTRGHAWAALPLNIEQRLVGALALSFSRPGPFLGEDRAFMGLVAQQCAQALERARLHDMELRARIRAEFAERRLAFIAEASERLSASLDYLASLANLAHISVPEIADWCVVHLLDDEGVPRLIAAVHSNPELAALRRELDDRYPVDLTEGGGLSRTLRTGEILHVEPMTDEYLRSIAHDDEHLELLRSFGLRAQISVPIVAEDRPVGVFSLGSAESGRSFSENDITLALELGRRAGNAVENARLYQAAHHASEAKSDFLAVMSHELRTPLNAIIGYSDLLLMGVPDSISDAARRQIERIRIASTSLLHLVEEVLSFSRVEAGKEELRISPVDIGPLLRECMSLIEPLASEKQLDLRVIEPETSVKVISDDRKIRQIVTNLLSNAVKFTERGSINVRSRDDGDFVLVEVEDTGIGISPEHIEKIFDPFWQVEQSATRRFGGTGLGLGVARKLARLLEGRLDVRSTPHEGSIFTLALPKHTPGMPRP